MPYSRRLGASCPAIKQHCVPVIACHQAAARFWRRTHCYVRHMASPFRCLHTFHVVLHLIETLVPDRVLLRQPARGGYERLWCKLKAANAPFLVRPHHAALFKHRKMLRKRRQGHVKWTCQLRSRGRSPSQPLDHSAPRRVGERLKDATDLLTSRCSSSPCGGPSADVSAHAGTHPAYREFDIRVRPLRTRSRRRVVLCSGAAAGA
jgi:hypothetical protein